MNTDLRQIFKLLTGSVHNASELSTQATNISKTLTGEETDIVLLPQVRQRYVHFVGAWDRHAAGASDSMKNRYKFETIHDSKYGTSVTSTHRVTVSSTPIISSTYRLDLMGYLSNSQPSDLLDRGYIVLGLLNGSAGPQGHTVGLYYQITTRKIGFFEALSALGVTFTWDKFSIITEFYVSLTDVSYYPCALIAAGEGDTMPSPLIELIEDTTATVKVCSRSSSIGYGACTAIHSSKAALPNILVDAEIDVVNSCISFISQQTIQTLTLSNSEAQGGYVLI